MSFKEITIDLAWIRADGKCECTNPKCSHKGVCGINLYGRNRDHEGVMGWKALHKKPVSEGGDDGLDNCLIICNECLGKLK